MQQRQQQKQQDQAHSLGTSQKIKMIVAMILTVLGWTAQALAQDNPTGPAPQTTPAATCVFKDLVSNEVCPAYATARALEVLGMGGEAVIFVERDATSKTAKRDRTSLIASSRIEDAVANEEIDEDDALLLEHEVQELAGVRYEIPTSRREITKFLGFPENIEIADSDWVEMIRVHAERTASMSAAASGFLLEQLGLSSGADLQAKAEPSSKRDEISEDKKEIAILKREALERSFAPVTTIERVENESEGRERPIDVVDDIRAMTSPAGGATVAKPSRN